MIPYATPIAVAPEAAWRDGPVLVVRNGVILPPRCVKCNAAPDGPYDKRTLSWHHPALYLLLLLLGPGFFGYLLLSLMLQKRGSLGVYLCAEHRRRRLTLMWTAGALVFAGFAAIFDSVASDVLPLLPFGILLLLGGLGLAVRCRTLAARKIDEHFMWLGGAAPEFLHALPSLPTRW